MVSFCDVVVRKCGIRLQRGKVFAPKPLDWLFKGIWRPNEILQNVFCELPCGIQTFVFGVVIQRQDRNISLLYLLGWGKRSANKYQPDQQVRMVVPDWIFSSLLQFRQELHDKLKLWVQSVSWTVLSQGDEWPRYEVWSITAGLQGDKGPDNMTEEVTDWYDRVLPDLATKHH